MKKLVYLSVILLLMVSSCSKVIPVTPYVSSGTGYWTLRGDTYNTAVFSAVNNTITSTSASSPYSTVTVIFPGSALPTITDIPTVYTVVNTRPIGNQVNIR